MVGTDRSAKLLTIKQQLMSMTFPYPIVILSSTCFLYTSGLVGASLMAQVVKNLPLMQKTLV